jgi:hypothetical protein
MTHFPQDIPRQPQELERAIDYLLGVGRRSSPLFRKQDWQQK